LDARVIERWRPGERSEVLADALQWQPDGNREAFRLDLPAFFAEVLGST
jgi:hypothetical protein